MQESFFVSFLEFLSVSTGLFLLDISPAFWLTGCILPFFMDKEERKKLIYARIFLHLPILQLFLLAAVYWLMGYTWDFLSLKWLLGLLALYLSIGALYFIFLMIRSPGRGRLWWGFVIACLLSILSFAIGLPLLLSVFCG